MLTYILLLGFLVTFAPKNVWHDCEHHDAQDHTENTFKKDHCEVCDLQLSTYIPSQLASLPVMPSENYEGDVFTTLEFTQYEKENPKLRGPPSMI